MSDTKPTHARGPGGVDLSQDGLQSLLGLPAGSVPLYTPPGFTPATLDDLIIHWPGTFNPTLGAGYAAPAGAIGVSAVAGIAWFHPLAGSPTTWIQMGTVWQLVAQYPELAALEAQASQLVTGFFASGVVAFPNFAALANNQTLLVGGKTFEAEAVLPFVPVAGRVTVDCQGLTTEQDIALAFQAAINGEPTCTVGALVPPVAGQLALLALAAGTAQNIPITGTLPGNFAGMAGGSDSLAASYPTLAAMVLAAPKTVNPQTGTTYQPTLLDAYEGGRQLTTLDNPAPITVTLPLEATVPFIATYGAPCLNFGQKGAGKVTFVAEGAGSVVPAATPSIAAQNGAVSAIPMGGGVWLLIGALSA